jgi:hypothetical protein
MDNPETMTTLGIQDTGQKQTRQKRNMTHKTKKMSNRDLHQKLEVNPGACEGLAVPASYKTPTMLLIESGTVKFLLMIEERQKLCKKENVLCHLRWIFRNSQPDHDNRRILGAT